MKTLFNCCAVLAVSIFLFNCGGSADSEKPTNDSTPKAKDSLAVSDSTQELKEFKFFKAIGDIPSPAHEIVIINKAGIKYNAGLPNPVENESKYADLYKACLNYGIYSCDLAYCASFKENADVMKYYLTSRKMAEKAGALSIFDEITKQYRFENNTKNSDSLEMILDKVYYAIEGFCQDQHKLDVAVKILLGSWIESQYLTLSHAAAEAKPAKTKQLQEKLWENYLHLRNILDLLKEYENHDELNNLNTSLVAYSELYKDAHGADDFSKDRTAKMLTALTQIRSQITQ
jgi:hypothetical protein